MEGGIDGMDMEENYVIQQISYDRSKEGGMDSTPMEESPTKSEETSINIVNLDEERLLANEEGGARRALWKEDKPAQSYRDKLMGINGKFIDVVSDDEEDLLFDQDFEEEQDAKKVEVGEEAFGPWMLAGRKARRRSRQNQDLQTKGEEQKMPTKNVVVTQQRFAAIAVQEEDNTTEEGNEINRDEPTPKKMDEKPEKPKVASLNQLEGCQGQTKESGDEYYNS
ncbi:uncharacterized protein G2W53_039172 [Senna tora]|uniref:Uncharacterized protein n=1 Tax=Senna tora TaxID=362788 RepID=A0A834SPI7_9FABA|nr:uncharacterized protein G2W53_039172 [Senna tora]